MSAIKEVYEESLKYVYYSEEQERRLQDKINNI